MKLKVFIIIGFLLFANIVFFTENLFSVGLQVVALGSLTVLVYKKEEELPQEPQEDIEEDVVKNLHTLLEEKEAMVKKLNNRFELAINASRDGFWDYNLETKEFYLSKAWRKRLGFREEEVVTYLNYITLIPLKERAIYQEQIQQLIEEFSEYVEYVNFSFTYPLVTRSGEKLLVEDNGNAFCNENKEVFRFVGFQRVV